MKTRCESWAFLFYKGCETARMCLICALLLKKCLAVCLTLCLASDARRCGRGGSGYEICGRSGCGRCICRAVSAGGFPIAGTGATWAGLIVCVVAATPGGICGRLPVRAAVRCGSYWAWGCGRAGGALPAWSVDDLPGGMWMQRATWAAVWLCAAGHGCRRGGAAACAARLDAVQCELR